VHRRPNTAYWVTVPARWTWVLRHIPALAQADTQPYLVISLDLPTASATRSTLVREWIRPDTVARTPWYGGGCDRIRLRVPPCTGVDTTGYGREYPLVRGWMRPDTVASTRWYGDGYDRIRLRVHPVRGWIRPGTVASTPGTEVDTTGYGPECTGVRKRIRPGTVASTPGLGPGIASEHAKSRPLASSPRCAIAFRE
jgi:hypothetical protein